MINLSSTFGHLTGDQQAAAHRALMGSGSSTVNHRVTTDSSGNRTVTSDYSTLTEEAKREGHNGSVVGQLASGKVSKSVNGEAILNTGYSILDTKTNLAGTLSLAERVRIKLAAKRAARMTEAELKAESGFEQVKREEIKDKSVNETDIQDTKYEIQDTNPVLTKEELREKIVNMGKEHKLTASDQLKMFGESFAEAIQEAFPGAAIGKSIQAFFLNRQINASHEDFLEKFREAHIDNPEALALVEHMSMDELMVAYPKTKDILVDIGLIALELGGGAITKVAGKVISKIPIPKAISGPAIMKLKGFSDEAIKKLVVIGETVSTTLKEVQKVISKAELQVRYEIKKTVFGAQNLLNWLQTGGRRPAYAVADNGSSSGQAAGLIDDMMQSASNQLKTKWASFKKSLGSFGGGRTLHHTQSDFLKKQFKVKNKNGRPRYENGEKNSQRRIYEWDSSHGGEIEVYKVKGNKGIHIGVFDPDGNLIKPAVKGRTIDL